MDLWRKKNVHVDYKKRPQRSFGEKKVHVDYNKGAPVELWRKKHARRVQQRGPSGAVEKKST